MARRQPPTLDHPRQRSAGNPQYARAFFTVSARGGQYPDDVLTLDLLQPAQRRGFFRLEYRRRGRTNGRGEVLRTDNALLRQKDGALKHILQLPNVAGPVV